MTSHGLLAAAVLVSLLAGTAVSGQRGRTGCDAAAPLPHSISADSVDVRPAVIRHQRLEYPRTLAMAGVTDEVLIEYDVDSAGVVDRCSIRVLHAKRPEFAASASEYVSALRFTPGIRDGLPVRTRLQQQIPFWQTNGARGRHHIF
jgi:TonB family protein